MKEFVAQVSSAVVSSVSPRLIVVQDGCHVECLILSSRMCFFVAQTTFSSPISVYVTLYGIDVDMLDNSKI